MVPTTNCNVIKNSEALAVVLNVSSGCLASGAKGWMMPNDLGFCSRIKKYWCHIQSPCWPFKKHKTKICINDALFEKRLCCWNDLQGKVNNTQTRMLCSQGPQHLAARTAPSRPLASPGITWLGTLQNIPKEPFWWSKLWICMDVLSHLWPVRTILSWIQSQKHDRSAWKWLFDHVIL